VTPVTARAGLASLRHYAATATLFRPTTLRRALARLQFLQADPIRAPARAQDLILRHRVTDYFAGDLERHYPTLGIAEDFFVNYGFVTRSLQALMHPRPAISVPAGDGKRWPAERVRRANLLLDFVRARGEVHPREVDAHFAHGKVRNAWGGTSNATTHLLDAMHYRGLLRVTRRDRGIRVYGAAEHAPVEASAGERARRLDALIDVVLRIYAPLPRPSLAFWVRRLRYAAPQYKGELARALARARETLSSARVQGVDWYWPRETEPARCEAEVRVRLLAPFDPVVQDRARFALLWGWEYRFEAYTPVEKRKLGYYALPILWRERVVGWANARLEEERLVVEAGYVGSGPPRERAFRRELEAETERLRGFLRVTS
jgi:uncharacterized protein YcaQ